MKNIADLNIDIADLMIICGHMQKEINELKAGKDFWFNQFYKIQKERNELALTLQDADQCMIDISKNAIEHGVGKE
jgi:hypothetical protein